MCSSGGTVHVFYQALSPLVFLLVYIVLTPLILRRCSSGGTVFLFSAVLFFLPFFLIPRHLHTTSLHCAGAQVVSQWTPQVTHVLQESGSSITPATVAAALAGVPVVTRAW